MKTIKNCWKKVIAYVCAITLVVTSLSVYQADVSADTDYSTLTYTTLTCENGPDLNYCVVEQNIEGWDDAPFYGDSGTIFHPIFGGVGINETADTKVSVNGVDVPVGTGAFVAVDSGLAKINPKVLPDNAYSVVEFTTTTGKAVIVFKKGNPTSGEAAEPETTTEPVSVDPTAWIDGTSTWTTSGVWNIWTGDAGSGLAISRYKGSNTLTDYYVNTITTTGQWSVQTNTVLSGFTVGKKYTYTITIESDKAGTSVGAKEDYSNSALEYVTLAEGENVITGSFTAAQTNAKLFLEMGNPANSGATFHITGVEVTDYVEVDDGTEGIPEGATWLGWFEAEKWANYAISDNTEGYTLTDKNIGVNWYSIQTGIDKVKFRPGVEYVCKFTLTASTPKEFTVDNRDAGDLPADAKVFVEEDPGEWIENEDGTWSYNFEGTYTNATANTQKVNIRVALGYHNNKDGKTDANYAANDVATFTLSDFSIARASGETPTPGGSGEQPSVDNESTTPEPVQTVQNENTYAAGFDDLMNKEFLLGDVGAEQFKAICGNGLINEIVNIQQSGDATEPGIYVTFKDANFGTITINGVPLDCYIEGSGIVMYLSNFEYMYSDVVVMNSDGSQKAVIYVYNAKGIDNSDKALGTETPPAGDTPAETTTSEPINSESTTPSVEDSTTVTSTTVTSTTVAQTTASKKIVVKRTKVKKATKTKASKKVKLSIKKVKGAKGYKVQFSTTKKFKKVLVTKNVKKANVTITTKKLKNKKKLYVRVKAYKFDGKKKVLAKKWSKAKKVKVRIP